MQSQQPSSLPRLEVSITHVLMDTSSRLTFPDGTIWKSRKGGKDTELSPTRAARHSRRLDQGGLTLLGRAWDRKQGLTLTHHQLDALLTGAELVEHPAHGSCPHQLVAHPHRQVAGDVLVVHVLVSLGRAGRAGSVPGQPLGQARPAPPSSHRAVDAPLDGGRGEGDGLAGQVDHLVLAHVQRGADGHDPRLAWGRQGTSAPTAPRGWVLDRAGVI